MQKGVRILENTAFDGRVVLTGSGGLHTLRRDSRYEMQWTGLFTYRTPGGAFDTSPEYIAEAALAGHLDFGNMLGSYRIALRDLSSGRLLLWSDNCGSMCFFFDTDDVVFSDSLLFLARRRKDVRPCPAAVARIFAGLPEIKGQTPVDGIMMTVPETLYIVERDGSLRTESKKLPALDSEGFAVDAAEATKQLVAALDGRPFTAVCTGGTDSRAVIAAVLSAGGDPTLVISGAPGIPDVRIAKKIADRLGRRLILADPTDRKDDWLAEAFEFSDGCYDTVLSYRHMVKTKLLCPEGFFYELGGCGGEFYKNVFYRKGNGIPSAARLYSDLYNSMRMPDWFGEALAPCAESIADDFMEALEGCCRSTRLFAYNDGGRYVIRSSVGSLERMLSRYCTKLDPLMEPRVVASVCRRDPKTLELHRWNRELIARCAPELADIPTDRGYTCSLDKAALRRDRILALRKDTVQHIKATGKRLSRRLASHSTTVWQGDYKAALDSAEFSEALAVCRGLGFISDAFDPGTAHIFTIGNILRIGLLFSEKYGLCGQK